MAKFKRQSSLDVGLLTDGMVIIQFGESVKQFIMTPEQATAIGLGLIKNAAHGESVQRVDANQPARKM